MESFIKSCTATAWYQREASWPFGALLVQKKNIGVTAICCVFDCKKDILPVDKKVHIVF
jgi:hypothetical protein